MNDAPPADTPRNARRAMLAFTIAGAILWLSAPEGLEQWVADLPYSQASEEALARVRNLGSLLRSLGAMAPAETVREALKRARDLRF